MCIGSTGCIRPYGTSKWSVDLAATAPVPRCINKIAAREPIPTNVHTI